MMEQPTEAAPQPPLQPGLEPPAEPGGEPPASPPPDASPAPPGGSAASGTRSVMLAAILVAVIVVGLVGYGAAGFAYAQTRISNADNALNTVISHQNQLNDAFKAIDSNFSALSASSNFNPTQARSVVDQFISTSQKAGRTIDQDDASLANAASGLDDQRWLTVVSRGNLDHEAARIAHARKGLAYARTIAAGHALDGQFFGAFIDAFVDLDTVNNQVSSGDFTGAPTTLAMMKTHLDSALQFSSAPGLPPEVHSLVVDIETLSSDYGKLLTAAQASDDAGVAAAEQSLQSDASKISSYNFDQINAKIDAYYKALVDGFNSEMAAATS